MTRLKDGTLTAFKDRIGASQFRSTIGEINLGPDPLTRELAKVGSAGSERWSVLRRYLSVADVAAATLAGTCAALVAGLSAERIVPFVALIAATWWIVAFVIGLYAANDLRSWASGVAEIPRLIVAGLTVSWPVFAFAALLDAPHAVEGALVGAPALVLTAGMARAGARTLIHRDASLRQRTLIVGSGHVAGQLVDKLKTHQQFGLDPFAMVDDDVYSPGSPDLPHVGGLDELPEILDQYSVHRVIIAFSRSSHEDLLRVIRACRERSVAVDVVPRLFEFLDGARALDNVGGLPLLSIGTPRLSRSAQLAKRGLDIAVSALALIVLSPLFAAIALIIKLESPGPVFFRQVRAGRGGDVFDLIKFRSMYEDAEQRKQAYLQQNDHSDGLMFKMREDPRVTRSGRILRRLSIDELPQLINVLKGEMSLVGPRPLILPEASALAEGWHQRRLDLRPGITGYWQVAGRSDVPFHEMVRMDYQYVAGWSLARDVEILLETVPAVLAGRGAY